MQKTLIFLWMSLLATIAQATISVQDGTGQTVTIPHEIRKVVTLTPHAAEYVLDTFSTLEHKLKSVIESKAKQRYRQ